MVERMGPYQPSVEPDLGIAAARADWPGVVAEIVVFVLGGDWTCGHEADRHIDRDEAGLV